MRHAEGDVEARNAALASIPGQLDFAWVGTWDNDQGKGFDLELAPEVRSGLTEEYEGRAGPLHWRKDVPKDGRGRYDLLQLMTPTRWSAAFAQGQLVIENPGTYALRIGTTDPLKVWVDGRLVFAAAQLERLGDAQGDRARLVLPRLLHARGQHGEVEHVVRVEVLEHREGDRARRVARHKAGDFGLEFQHLFEHPAGSGLISRQRLKISLGAHPILALAS
jgi:hypothetical protein